VPLSEDEQRILQEIEQHFYANDPDFAREVGSTSIYRHAGRNLKWAALGFVLGIVLLISTLSTPVWGLPLLAFAGFMLMLGSAFFFERNLRRMGKAGWQQWTESMRAAGVREHFGTTGKRMRDRFRKEE
jgi:hypothetical protein